MSMPTKIWKIFLPLSISLIFLFTSSSDLNSCGGGWETEGQKISLFDYALLESPTISEFLPYELTDRWMNSSISKVKAIPNPNPKNTNLKEWGNYFNNIPKVEDISTILYDSKREDLETLSNYLTTSNWHASTAKWGMNSLIQYFFANQDTATVKYFVFAKTCEPEVSKRYYWRPAVRDTVLMNELINEGIENIKTVDSEFLKLRYAFQIVRLAHYLGEFENAINFYDKYVEGSQVESIIKYWALSHKAGCLKSLKRNSESLYQFVQVYNLCPTRQIEAKRSFRIYDDKDLEDCLTLCKTPEDSVTAWWLAGYNYKEHSAKSLKEIYKHNPKSPYLEVLLIQKIRNSEYRTLPFPGDYEPFLPLSSSRDSSFYDVLKKICNENNVKNPYLWNYAAGYYATLIDEPRSAFSFYQKARSIAPENNKLDSDRIKVMEIISSIDTSDVIDSNVERNLLDNLKWLKGIRYVHPSRNPEQMHLKDKPFAEEAFEYVMQKLADKYLKQNDSIKYHLCIGAAGIWDYSLQNNPVREPIDKLLAFHDKDNKSKFEEFIRKGTKAGKSNLIEIKGTLLLAEYKLEEAVIYFEQVDWSGISNRMRADPFSVRINDCRDCDFREGGIDGNKLTFTKELIKLEKLKDEDKTNSATHYFNLANAYYNMTHFGNSSSMVDYDRDPDFYFLRYYRYLPDSLSGKIYKVDNEYIDCSKALEYYQKAMDLTTDKEFAAKCCFMASKCEQNRYYVTYIKRNMENKKKFRTYFDKMISEYSDTEYYKEVIDECKYFQKYVSQNYKSKNVDG